MKNRAVIIICYFGRLPDYFDLWELSCGSNPRFDFVVVTDQDVISKYDNIRIVTASLEDVRDRLATALERDVTLDIPYKLCDYKPMYGVAFADMLREYEFWGMCDMDMIFGDLSVFITDEVLDEYDKIFQLGHLTLYRNTDYTNWSFKKPGWVHWENVIESNYHKRLCERGMMKKHAGMTDIKIYNPYVYVDVSKIHRRYMRSRFLTKWYQRRNYRFQVFYWEDGKIFRAAMKGFHICVDEFAYIHFQKREIRKHSIVPGNPFYISRNGFYEKRKGIPALVNIIKMNPYPGALYELYEEAVYGRKKKAQNEKINQKIAAIENKKRINQ